MDVVELLPKALEKNVAYGIGQAFYADKSGRNTFRVSFCHETEAVLEGIRRLGNAVSY